MSKNSPVLAKRLFLGRDGKWYAEGWIGEGLDKKDVIVELSDAFDLNSIAQKNLTNRNQKYVSKQQSETHTVKQSHATTPNQQSVLDAIKKKAEESTKYVKEVTPDYYLIEVEGTKIKMPRVHTIMPKYWAESESPFMPALQVGNAFDNLARMFFGDKNNLSEYEQNKQDLVQRLYDSFASDGKDEKMSKKKYSDLIPNRPAFEAIIDDLYNLFDQYDKLGWELSTEPIVWHAKFNNGWLAGETDMLGVDQEGNIHIIDFKTASSKIDTKQNPFGRFETKYTFSLPAELESRREQLSAEDF